MEAKPFAGVLVAAVLLGMGLGGAAVGVQRLVAPSPSTTKTITAAATTAQTQKTATGNKATTGTTAASTQSTSTAVASVPAATSPASVGRSTVSGMVTSLKDGLITITKSGGGSLNVVTGASTTFQKQAPVTLADLTEGLTVTVLGTSLSDGTLQATTVTFGSMTPNLPGQQQPNETRLPNFSGLPAGQPGAGSTRATSTFAPGTAAPPTGGETIGTIQSISGSKLNLRTVGGASLVVSVGTGTAIQRISTASLAEVVVGASVTATGTTQSDGSLQANSVTIISGK